MLSVFFCYATLYVCCFGDGLESDFVAQRKREKQKRKAADKRAEQDHAEKPQADRDPDPRRDTSV